MTFNVINDPLMRLLSPSMITSDHLKLTLKGPSGIRLYKDFWIFYISSRITPFTRHTPNLMENLNLVIKMRFTVREKKTQFSFFCTPPYPSLWPPDFFNWNPCRKNPNAIFLKTIFVIFFSFILAMKSNQ